MVLIYTWKTIKSFVIEKILELPNNFDRNTDCIVIASPFGIAHIESSIILSTMVTCLQLIHRIVAFVVYVY